MIPTGCPKSPMSTSTWSGSSAGRSTPTPSAGWTRGLPETYPWWWNCTGSPHCVVGAPTVTVAVYPIISPQKCPGCEPFPHIGAERAGLRSRILRRVRTGFRRHPFMATGWRLFLPASDPPDRGPGGRRTGPGWRRGNRLAQGRHGVGTGEFGVSSGWVQGWIGAGCGVGGGVGTAETGGRTRDRRTGPAPVRPRRDTHAGRAARGCPANPSEPAHAQRRWAVPGTPNRADRCRCGRSRARRRGGNRSAYGADPARGGVPTGPGRRPDRTVRAPRPNPRRTTTEPSARHGRPSEAAAEHGRRRPVARAVPVAPVCRWLLGRSGRRRPRPRRRRDPPSPAPRTTSSGRTRVAAGQGDSAPVRDA